MIPGSENSTEAVVERHMRALMARDFDSVMKDYASDAVLFTASGTIKGAEALRAFFEASMSALPPEALANFKLIKKDTDGEYGYILWSAAPLLPFAGDTFHIRNGKIVAQSGVAQMGL